MPKVAWLGWLGSFTGCGGPDVEVHQVPNVEPAPATVSPYGLDARAPNGDCDAPNRPPTRAHITLTRLFEQLPPFVGQTTTLVQPLTDGSYWYVLEQEGRVKRFANTASTASVETVLDLTPRVSCCNELGLLGMTFHPNFAMNGYVYLTYTTVAPPDGLVARVSRFTSPDGGATLDPASEQVVIYLVKNYENHHGGNVDFGPDGMLYVGYGDGGSNGDVHNLSQDPFELYGKMLRLDVDHPDPGLPYGIPGDNPFAAGGGLPEVWAYGFRQPWRWSFDPVTGDLWLGDVGMHTYEEIDKVVPGANYGWRLKEAAACNNPPVDCDPDGITTDPVVWYDRSDGHVVVGGHVYRGTAVPNLVGTYLFNDYGGDDIFQIVYDPVTGAASMEVAEPGSDDIVDWSYGADGESYLLSVHGNVYRIDPDDEPVRSNFPQTLSETGCFDPDDPSAPLPALVPFSPAHPFWSDGLSKRRWLALPDGATIHVDPATGDFDLPVGAMLFKEFTAPDGARVETRMFVHHDDGWTGYTYAWRPDGTDADLQVTDGQMGLAGGGTWDLPSRAQCLECHTSAAGSSLGLELAQLDTDLVYPLTGRTGNQLDTLDHIGMFDAPITHPGPLPALDGDAPVEDRARTYLQVNCSPCHRPDSESPVALDLRRATPLAETGLCGVPEEGDLGIADARIVAPGDPSRSVLSARVHRRGADQMPPIGTNVVDDAGVAVLDAWITDLPSCP